CRFLFMIISTCRITLLALGLAALGFGCSKETTNATPTANSSLPHKHEHKAPHGGTAVVLGNELYHVEFVLDSNAGKLEAFLLDGEMESFVRSADPQLEVKAEVAGKTETLMLKPIANIATGETEGNTALFEGEAPWLKETKQFDAVLRSVTLRGTTFTEV